MLRQTWILTAAISLGSVAFAGPIQPTFQLDPAGGTVTGSPGNTIGWGFTLTNTVNWLVVTGSQFTPNLVLGTYADFIGPNFVVVGPSPDFTSVSQSFDPDLFTGTGAFTIDPLAGVNSTATGQLVLTYDLYSVSPNDSNFDPFLDTVSLGNTSVANATIQVVGAPEPDLSWALGILLIAITIYENRIR